MKIFIIGTSINANLKDIARGLQAVNDDLSIAPIFTTDLKMRGKTGEDTYYMSNEEVELSYKNNAFMWVRTLNDYSIGVTMPDMYNSNIFVMSYADFNNMSNPVLQETDKEDLVICVIDETGKKTNEDVLEAQSAFERIYEHHYLYFLDDKPQNVINIILKYVIASPEEREEIEQNLNN